MLKGKSITRRAALAAAVLAFAGPAASQDYPTRPVRLIVPYGAGGASDVMARFYDGDDLVKWMAAKLRVLVRGLLIIGASIPSVHCGIL